MHRIHAARLSSAVLIVLALFSRSAPAQAAPPTRSELAAYADRVLSEAYPAGEPGAAAILVKDGEVVLRKGYGMANLELGVPVEPDMVFELGSVTKQFTAAAILMLAERGKLKLEDDFRTYLTGYPDPGKKVTIEHLLTHTSGIPSYTGLPEWFPRRREDMPVETLVAVFKDKPLEFEPGGDWAYNNSAYVLLGAILEKVSGKTYEQFVEEEIFQPLGMTRSRYGHATEVVPRRASGYARQGEEWKNADYISMTQPYAAGSLLSTVDDLVLWDEALSGEKLLKKASIERMFTPVRMNSGRDTRYGYGWSVFDWEGRRIIEHGGDIFGFTSYVTRVPQERMMIAILSNDQSADPRPNALIARILAKSFGAPLEERKPLALAARDLDEYVGVYRFDEKTTRTVTREGSKLYSQRSGSSKVEIIPLSRDEFATAEETRLRFRRDARGRIAGLDLAPRFGPEAVGDRTDEAPPAERQAVTVDPALYDAYAGEYELAPGFRLKITREGDQIFGQPTGQPKAELFPASETRFFLRVVEAEVEFQRGPDGQATGLVLHQGGRDVPAKKVK